MVMKNIRQQFHRFAPARSTIWTVSLVMTGLSVFTVVGWVGHSRFVALQHERPDIATVQAKTNHLSDDESRLQAQAVGLAHLGQDLERQRAILQSVISVSKNATSVQTKMLSLIDRKVQQNTRRLEDLELDQAMVKRIAEKSSASVCMIVGEYVWIDQASGLPLRYEGLDAAGEPLRWPEGQEQITTGGSGPMLVREFSGTGFLIDSAGMVLTSGYLLMPWERDPLIQQAGDIPLIPRIQLLHAYFAGVDKPFDLTIAQTSENGDMVICRFDPGDSQLPSLPLQQKGGRVSTGEPVVLLGYPGGADLMQARLPEEIRQAIVRSGRRTSDEVARELARRGWIQPLAIQGRISGQFHDRLFYDAATTFGGSGGPLLNKRGEVVGVEFAISPTFSGSNLAISIGSLQRWLAESGFGAAPGKSVASGQQRRIASPLARSKLNPGIMK